MNWYFSAIVVICVGAMSKAKYLHMKESPTERTDDIAFQDFYKYDENVFTDDDTENNRYARHVELVTESVLEHLLNEINAKYPHSSNDSITVPKMLQRLKMKLKKHMKKKNKKLKKKKSRMNSTAHEITTTTTTTTTEYDSERLFK